MNGQDFPLKTNLEMVRTLSSLKGRNSLESVELCDSNKWRVKKIHEIVNGAIQVCHLSSLCPDYCQTGINDRHPSNYDLFNCFRPQKRTRGRLHSTCPFGQAVPILWSAKATSAFARLVKWQDQEGPPDSYGAVYPECHGTHVRAVCVYGVENLQWMLQQHHLFANKFDTDSDSLAIYCLEKYLRQKALDEKVY